MSILSVLAVIAAAQATPSDEQERLHAFADNLAAETGVPVAYITRGRNDEALPHLRVGSAGRAVIVLVPGRLEGEDPIRQAFAGDVEAVCVAIAQDAFLAQALAEVAVLIPLDLGPFPGASNTIDPNLNFPVRWSSARAAAGERAGPYPGILPRVARLSDWILDRTRCAAVVLAGNDVAATTTEEGAYGPGSVAAFCAERVGAQVFVSDRTRAGRAAALRAALAALPRLELQSTRWQRLGPTSWALDLDVVNVGSSATATGVHARARRRRGITLNTTMRSEGVRWAASALGVGARDPLRVVPRGAAGLVLPDLNPGQRVRVRLFFSGDAAVGATVPVVDVEARAPRAQRAVATRLSP